MKKENQSTRREFLKAAAFGAGLLIGGEQIAFAQRRGVDAGQGRQGRQGRRALSIASDNPSIQLQRSLCRRECGRCVELCRDTTTVYGQSVPPGEDACVYCGQCTFSCRYNAITEKYHYPATARAIADPDKIVIASTAPAIRVALGEMYRLAPGTNVEGKIVGALKKLGVDHVIDTTFAADLTIMEEASELLQRLEKNDAKNPPMFTSCCPAWVRFARLFYPGVLPNLSTAKSPVMMQGALVKTWFAQKTGINPEKIVHVALTPCTAKKAEILLPGMNAAGVSHGKPGMRDVDIALTCRELAHLLNESKVDFARSQDAPYNSLMGAGSGAGMIFGNTGGVAEAALRTAYKLLNGKNPPAEFLDLQPVRGMDSVRQASVDLGKRRLSVAVVHGIGKARPVIESIRGGARKFDFVEVMACPGGCIGGGGQPPNSGMSAARVKQLRLDALYKRDAGQEIRLSCDNPQIKAIYGEFLDKPLGERSKRLLHIAI
ncbi:MAG: [FeFe] hydrogenase, group A [Acidobacteriota bacterium]|nr:[FeFe] hydrogenase, group A [Acidobacteriota bacterium]